MNHASRDEPLQLNPLQKQGTGYNILVAFVVTEEWFSFIESEASYILAWAPSPMTSPPSKLLPWLLRTNFEEDGGSTGAAYRPASNPHACMGFSIGARISKQINIPTLIPYFKRRQVLGKSKQWLLLQWLAPTSVLYVSHASLDSATGAQLEEGACALAV